MTNEELTAAFPECERIKREQVAPFVEQVFNEVQSWRQIGYKIKGLCQQLWPKPQGVKWEDLPEDFACPLCGAGKDEFNED